MLGQQEASGAQIGRPSARRREVRAEGGPRREEVSRGQGRPAALGHQEATSVRHKRTLASRSEGRQSADDAASVGVCAS
jgi:hypothetical protein